MAGSKQGARTRYGRTSDGSIPKDAIVVGERQPIRRQAVAAPVRTEDACKLCGQTGGRKELLRNGCHLCGYEGCVIHGTGKWVAEKEIVIDGVSRRLKMGGEVKECSATNEAPMDRLEMLHKLELLYGQDNVQVEERIDEHGAYIIESYVRVGAGVRIEPKEITTRAINDGRHRLIELLKGQLK